MVLLCSLTICANLVSNVSILSFSLSTLPFRRRALQENYSRIEKKEDYAKKILHSLHSLVA